MSLCLCTDNPFIIVVFEEDLGSEKEKARESLVCLFVFHFSTFHFLIFLFCGGFPGGQGFPGGSHGKESACNAGDPGSIPGSRRSPGEGKGYPLHCPCLENSMDRGAWWDHKELDTTE